MAEPLVWRFPAGLNNRSQESALPEGALRVCNNLDISRDGELLARRGLRQVLSGFCHSFYGSLHRQYALLVKDGVLTRWDGSVAVALRTVNATAPMVYAELNHEVFFTNGFEQGRVNSAGVLAPWGLPTPPAPIVTAIDTGGLRAGTVQVTLTAIVDGLESGAPEPARIAVGEGGGVQITTPTSSASFAIYRTAVDDNLFYRVVIVAGSTTLNIGEGPLGARLESLYATKPLPGQALTTYHGRLWVASESIVWFTDTRSPHWLFPHEAYYAFGAPVVFLGTAEDGIFVGTASQIFFLEGKDPTNMTQRLVSSQGAIAGQGVANPPIDILLGQGNFPSQCCMFMNTDGIWCIGRPGGVIQQITKDTYVAGFAGRAAMSYSEHEGLRQIVVLLTESSGAENKALDALTQATFSQTS